MKKIAIFASAGGSNFRAIYNNIQRGYISGKIVLVISNNPQCNAIIFAIKKGLEIFIVNNTRFPDTNIRDKLLLQTLLKADVELICLAGYMKLLPRGIVKEYKNRILNIHPALLPKFGGKGFYGMKVHEAVIASGIEESGVTVHLVDEEYDHGKIIAQKRIEVRPEDTAETLAKRVLEVEHNLYPKVVKVFCNDRVVWKNNHPIIEV